MDTPFRNDVDALKTRLASLDEELSTLRGKAREYATVQERLTQLERESADVRREIDARSVRRATPFLDTLRIASPCNEPWEGMVGDERSRFCGKCQKDVHNISSMTRMDAEALLESVASSICVRMYQRLDGTILTADCPVGVRKKRVKRLFLATIGGGIAAAAGVLAFWRYEESEVMGKMSIEVADPVAGSALPAPTFATPPPAVSEQPVMVTAGIAPMRERPQPVIPPQTKPLGKPAPPHR
jgi:hypothetical protein